MHQIFEEFQYDIHKLYYKLIIKAERHSSIRHRKILPIHLIRNNGEIRSSVNEIARAIETHWTTTNVVGVASGRFESAFFRTKKYIMRNVTHTRKSLK